MTERWADVETLAAKLIEFLETNTAPDGFLADDVFLDFSMPQWRVQTQGAAELVAARRHSHPALSKVPRHRLDATERGFVLELEETWSDAGGDWYCREMYRADVGDDGLVHRLSVYCTGDWDEATVAQHKAMVTLIQP